MYIFSFFIFVVHLANKSIDVLSFRPWRARPLKNNGKMRQIEFHDAVILGRWAG